MAETTVSVRSALDPETAWDIAANLNRVDEWLTIFGGWKSAVPERVSRGTKISMLVKVKTFRNTIHWTVTEFDEPHRLALTGTGRGGVELTLAVEVSPDGAGSLLHLDAGLHGKVLDSPVGKLVARVLETDIESSINNLARLS